MKTKDNRKIIRTQNAGVFFGTVKSRIGKECVIENARRIWYWAGACSLSQLAVEGTKNPIACKFPVAVPSILVTDIIEIIDTTPEARVSIDGVPIWKT